MSKIMIASGKLNGTKVQAENKKELVLLDNKQGKKFGK